MRKTFALLLMVCLLPLAAAAQERYTVSDLRRQAASGWHRTYEANGRTITVDIPISVPAVEVLPVLSAVSAHPSEQVPVQPQGGAKAHAVGDTYLYNRATSFSYRRPGGEEADEGAERIPRPERLAFTTEVFFDGELAWDTACARGNPATLRDVHALVERVAAAYFPQEQALFIPWRMKAGTEARAHDGGTQRITYGDAWEPYAGPLTVSFYQLMCGVPFLGAADAMLIQPSGGRAPSLTAQGNLATVKSMGLYGRGQGAFAVRGWWERVTLSLLREQAVLVEDIPLCGLGRMIAAYEALIRRGQLRRVDSLRLGYVGWYRGGTSEAMTLVPCWALDGLLQRTAREEPVVCPDSGAARSIYDEAYHTVLVNAQTGELIGPWRRDADRSYDPPPFTGWP